MRSFALIFALMFIVCSSAIAQDTSCGIVWEPSILLSDSNYRGSNPKIALSGDDTIHIIWEQGNTFSKIRLPYKRSVNGGVSFESTRELLTDSSKFPYPASWTYVLANGNLVYVFFVGSSSSQTPVRMVTSHDRGNSWDTVKNISASTDTSGIISSASINGDTIAIDVPPQPNPRRILRSTDRGLTWTRSNTDIGNDSQIALTSNGLHLVQLRLSPPVNEVEYKLSHDLGDTWDKTAIISDDDGIPSDVPLITSGSSSSDSLVMVIWREYKYGCLDIIGCSIASRTGKVSGDSLIWNNEEILTDQPRGYPTGAATYGNSRAAAWGDAVVPNQISHAVTKVSPDVNSSWCPTIDHTPNSSTIILVAVAVSKKAVHVVWQDFIGGTNDREFIYYRRGKFVQTSVENETEVPKDVRLSQNYPNPFNPVTKINYRLPNSQYVNITVYDVFGREVIVLVNERKQAGEYEAEWNATGLASGIYFYKIMTGTTILTKKALLIK